MRWLAVMVVVGGCGGDGKDTATGTGETGDTETTEPTTTPGVCVSGDEWTLGDLESPLMHPGMDCIACHESRFDAPDFAIAGTVYTAYHEPDDCNGRARVTIEITDADGDVFEVDSNSAGNFYLETFRADVTMPYTARVLVNGTETNAMVGAQSDGACNHCHTEDGRQSAPGRIIVGD